MIRTAERADLDALHRIWTVCFGDGADYQNFFFRQAFQPEKTLIWDQGGQIGSMLFLLDGTVWSRGREYSAAYIYAAGTLPEFRSQGHMGALIHAAQELCRARGIACLTLVPAEEGLFRYYGRFGFRPYFHTRLSRVCGSGEAQGAVAWCSEPPLYELEQLRREAVRRSGGLMWNGPQFEYAVREHLFTGGQLFFNADGYALYHPDSACCRVDEQITLPGRRLAFERAFLSAVPAHEYRIAASDGPGEDQVRGMLLPLGEPPEVFDWDGQPYIGLTLG